MKHKYLFLAAVLAASVALFGVARAQNSDDGYKNENATATASRATASARDKMMSEDHQSVVSKFTQSLLKVADREGSIGKEVREVAKSQNDSATTTVSAMKKVEERGSIRKFLFGSDYKNLGVIRSELATTTQNIDKLKLTINKVIVEADRIELNIQIQNLETQLTKINTYLTAHEGVFSLFGWFNKIINK